MTNQTMTRTLAVALLSCLFSALVPSQSFAQYYDRSSGSDHHVVLGFAPISLIAPNGKVNVHGEWTYGDNKSISALVAVPMRSKMPNWLTNWVAVDQNGQTTTNNLYDFGIVVENRFYIGSDAPSGFYLAPYARYNRIWLRRTTVNSANQGETTITGALGGFGLGGALGWQFQIGDHFTIDATIVGLDAKWMGTTLYYSTTDPTNEIGAFRDKVQNAVKDIPLIGSSLAASIDGNQVKVHGPGLLLPAYRFNLTVNYVF
jgi:hypothetical protein